MKPLRGRAMIAATMSRVRPAGRRTVKHVEVPPEPTVPSAPAPATVEPNAPYSLVGW
jgi:hypothetical protein